MASLLRRALPRTPPPPLRLLASLDKLRFSDSSPSPFSSPRWSPIQGPPPLPDASSEGAPLPSLHASPLVFPTFPLSFLACPIVPPLDDRSDAELDDRTGVWADSVKKKRKKKMNKHKYRKLRRRLRYKSK